MMMNYDSLVLTTIKGEIWAKGRRGRRRQKGWTTSEAGGMGWRTQEKWPSSEAPMALQWLTHAEPEALLWST